LCSGSARRSSPRRAGPLALAHELGDALREILGAKRGLAENDLADRLVDDSSKRDMCAPF